MHPLVCLFACLFGNLHQMLPVSRRFSEGENPIFYIRYFRVSFQTKQDVNALVGHQDVLRLN